MDHNRFIQIACQIIIAAYFPYLPVSLDSSLITSNTKINDHCLLVLICIVTNTKIVMVWNWMKFN